ncbi:fimbrial biogenesis chaperone [Citrobacter koseri]|uniref:fimbrial biogenesis chaperone n=1 Tax=Citrobacter koseri TaxID=545 RepID=UPI001A17F7CB|nr:molecular chaperone [Citrobacter koseri]HDQ2586113.1 molecular chaperone [Citrobacter koseri]
MAKRLKYVLNHFLILLLLPSSAMSATYINYTRVIINEKARETSFTIYNEGLKPVLLQLWTEKDNIFDRPEEIKTPFIILPPIFRLEGKTSRAVRVQFTGDQHTLPADRESLFWLNTLEVPPVADSKAEKGALQVAFRTRVKLFWRPTALAAITLEESIKELHISLSDCGGKRCLLVKNNSPLYVTLMDLALNDGTEIKQLPDDGLWAPLSTKTVVLPKNTKGEGTVKTLSWIDDYGVVNTYNY